MKQTLRGIVCLLLCCLSVVSGTALCHSGRTDSNGGHYNRKTGQYHYHNSGKSSGISNSGSNASYITNPPVKTNTPKPTINPTLRPTATPPASPASIYVYKKAGEFRVFHAPGGLYYHAKENCSGMCDAYEDTLENSILSGYKQCIKCQAPNSNLLDQKDVVWCAENYYFHITDECSEFHGIPTIRTIQNANIYGYKACKKCGVDSVIARSGAIIPIPVNTPDEDTCLAVYLANDKVFHISDACPTFIKAGAKTSMFACQALRAGYIPCKLCFTDKE